MTESLSTKSALAGVLVAILAGGGMGFAIGLQAGNRGVTFSTPYQAILLSNGSVYYGKLQGYGTSHPVLNEVYYIVTSTNPETKQPTNVLVRRGKELHSPDRMYLNASQIVFVEPVGTHSRVAELINEDR
jgi:hypothetical protein